MRLDAPLLARDAEGMFWMARYLERVENLARLIDVAQSFESPGYEAETWLGILRLNSDEEAFAARGFSPDPEQVKRFYLLDRGNPTSVAANIEAARTNARTLRPLISTEMWRHLNVFHRFVSRISTADLEGDLLSRLCARLREGVQAHQGIIEGTLYRDLGWHFHELGRLIERADQTTRLLDVKYHTLAVDKEARRVAELTRWHAVLRAAAGYHAFKRLARASFSAEDVLGFLLRDPSFPRSVLLSVRRVGQTIEDLRRLHQLSGLNAVMERLDVLRDVLTGRPTGHILDTGLHEYLDMIQVHLHELSAAIGTAFFRDWRPNADAARPAEPRA